MILGPDGEKLSKRHGAVNVMEYDAQGYLPEAMINYLSRLGWSHGDDELFTREQLVQWFDTDHLSKSASQWDPKKLNWVNAHYIKQMDNAELAVRVAPRIEKRGGNPAVSDLPAVMGLLKDRAETLELLAESAMLFCKPYTPAAAELVEQHLTPAAREALADFAQRAVDTDWTREGITTLIKAVLADRGMKMPQLAIPLRVAVVGQTQTPAVDAVLTLIGKDTVLQRLAAI